MKNWRDRLLLGHEDIKELSAESMAVTRIMKGLGASQKDVGKLCKSLGIDYNEEDTTFNRAVNILRATYDEMRFVKFVDIKIGKKISDIYEELLENTDTGIVFFRVDGTTSMTALVKGLEFKNSALGQLLIKPGIRYLAKRAGVELWEQDPVLLIKSFSRRDCQ